MTEGQKKLGWWAVILLSIVSAITGIVQISADSDAILQLLFFAFVVPIVLLFGFAFYRSGDRSKNETEK